MSIELNHTIVACRDKVRSSTFITELFGLPPATDYGPFKVVNVANGVSLDYIGGADEIQSQHFAFLVSDDEFTAIHGRIVDGDIDHWADPGRSRPGELNHHDGGRGVYFCDPDGHFLEIITRPYGGGDGPDTS